MENNNRYPKYAFGIVLISFILFSILISNNLKKENKKISLKENQNIEVVQNFNNYDALKFLQEFRIAYKLEDYLTCNTLYDEMKIRFPNDTYTLYAKQLVKSIKYIKLQNMENIYLKTINQIFLSVDAAAYPDGLLSCNVYLYDNNSNLNNFNGGTLEYIVFNSSGKRLKVGKTQLNGTRREIFIDIPLGVEIYSVNRVQFIYTSENGDKITSEKVKIEFES